MSTRPSSGCLLALVLAMPLLGGCAVAVIGGVAIGASAVHDRRGASGYFSDKSIYLAAYDSLNKDKELALKNDVNIVVYNGVILLVGEVHSEELKQRAQQLVSGFEGTQRVVNELEIAEPEGFWANRRNNTITAHVKTALLDVTGIKDFDPTRVNVTTAHGVVYLMGWVTPQEADAVVAIARKVAGVERVVKVFEYMNADEENASGVAGAKSH